MGPTVYIVGLLLQHRHLLCTDYCQLWLVNKDSDTSSEIKTGEYIAKANSISFELSIPELSQDIYFENSESCYTSFFTTQKKTSICSLLKLDLGDLSYIKFVCMCSRSMSHAAFSVFRVTVVPILFQNLNASPRGCFSTVNSKQAIILTVDSNCYNFHSLLTDNYIDCSGILIFSCSEGSKAIGWSCKKCG